MCALRWVLRVKDKSQFPVVLARTIFNMMEKNSSRGRVVPCFSLVFQVVSETSGNISPPIPNQTPVASQLLTRFGCIIRFLLLSNRYPSALKHRSNHVYSNQQSSSPYFVLPSRRCIRCTDLTSLMRAVFPRSGIPPRTLIFFSQTCRTATNT